MDSAAPRMTGAQSTGPGLTGRFVWRSLTAAVVVGAAVIVWVFPHAHRAMEPGAAQPVSSGQAPSADSTGELITAISEAVQRGDLATARTAWLDAYRSLRRTRDWQGMAALGDTALEVAGGSGTRQPWEADARQAYLGALFRARAEASLDGVLRATGAFATLGDRDIAEEGLRIAESVALRMGTAEARDRVLAHRARFEGRDGTFHADGPSRVIRWDAGP
jgi:hypothetical protein